MSNEEFGTSVPQLPSASKKEEAIERPAASATVDLICTKLQDRNFNAYELMRLVTYLKAALLVRMLKAGCTIEEVHIRHCLYQCIDPLRNVGRSISETDKLPERADVILWDG